MKKTFIFGLIAAALGFTACSSEDDLNVNNNQNNLTIFPFGQGEAEAKGIGKVKWVQLWENGPRFAEFNVGANSATEYGGYYTWGGTYNNNPALEGFTWTDDHNEGESNLSCTGDNITDTATKLWGSNWRMPTQEELAALLNQRNCICTWTENYKGTGVTGLLCTGMYAYSSNSVFLPAAGFCYYGHVNNYVSEGHYWSSTPNDYFEAYNLYFRSDFQRGVVGFDRDDGYSVRAVLAE